MDKNYFFKVFSDINLDDDLTALLKNAEIEKITTNSKNDAVRIYLINDKLIFREKINKLEKGLEMHFYANSNNKIRVKIMEKYNLSKQFTPKSLYEIYKDSILLELKENSILLYNTLKKSKIEFENDTVMLINSTETIITTTKSDELKSFLEYVICIRCSLDVDIRFIYNKPGNSSYRAQSDIELLSRAKEISSNTKEARDKLLDSKSDNDYEKNKTSKKPLDFSNDTKSKGALVKEKLPDLIYGKTFEDELLSIDKIIYEMGEVAILGEIQKVDIRSIKNEKSIVMFTITDYTDSITVKLFIKDEMLDELNKGIYKSAIVKVKGIAMVDKFDKELNISSVTGIMKTTFLKTKRTDNSTNKRVELHCHTKMSDMDGVADPKKIVKRAYEWGHKAVAITDHGVVQGFTEAFHAYEDLKRNAKKNNEPFDFKIIYGVEAYLVDDLKDAIVNSKNQELDSEFVVFDIETTGLSPLKDRIIEIGASKISNGKITEEFSSFVNPNIPIPFRIEQLTGINDNMVINAPTIEAVLKDFLDFCKDSIVVAHNADFDTAFIINAAKKMNISYKPTIIDTVGLSRMLLPNLSRYKLDTVAKALGIKLLNHHRAVDDARCTTEIFLKLIELLKQRDITTLDMINKECKLSKDTVKKLNANHAIILAKNEIGRINLYRLISTAHIDYFYRQPRIPKSEYLKYSEGLIIGSACEAGELYQALLSGKSEEDIAKIAQFYDYLEIQPLGNNKFMLKTNDEAKDSKKRTLLDSNDDLIEINKKIVQLGERFNKLVVATCDVHFIEPEDEIYRRIIMAGKGFDDADDQAPLYFRNTEEMIEEFEYLGSEKAYEVVVTNTNLIASQIDCIEPVHPDKFPPVIEDSDKMLREICYEKAHTMYGENLPEVVVERLERELDSIISNGFAVMYIIAQKLVWKSNEDGYLVGSRGSVGSSFVATMAGITEVNPLKPHYYCKHCNYSDFDSELVKSYSGGAGCDMPDRECPNCKKKLEKDGFDIPFETFLGFKGNKEPDIDLNFSGDYQSKAHDYTEELFGKGQTFRAGTIGTLAEKTAFGYVKKYFEERDIVKRKCEIERIASGCVGVRKTTGQHPGGIIVLPHGEEIYKFTPVQRPANDMTTKTITTHFDYHSIDHNLLKLDILGHDDPTMIKMLEELTGVNAKEIALDNKEVMSLFDSTKALGINPADIGGCKLGSLGIPEFGTDFVIQMLLDTKPKSFSDLIRISGLSHGTNVWLGNAQTLIQEGKATISTAICTRDDIMTYLIDKGVDSELSFKIMESVRKGKGLLPDWENAMLEAGVPDWYIWSCKNIAYMFPKAHAAAYVMMAFRIAYFKVYYPLAYYAAFFSIRATAFSYELMCRGKDKLDYFIKDYIKRNESKMLTNKEEDQLKDMKIVQEMYARGFDFLPLDIYKSHYYKFQIIDGKLLPPFSTIEGLGDKAAESVYKEAKGEKFLSKEDFRQRTKVTKTTIELMSDFELFGDLPDSNQISMFDFC